MIRLRRLLVLPLLAPLAFSACTRLVDLTPPADATTGAGNDGSHAAADGGTLGDGGGNDGFVTSDAGQPHFDAAPGD